MPCFAQGPLTLDLDVYGSIILDVPLFVLVPSKGGRNTQGPSNISQLTKK